VECVRATVPVQHVPGGWGQEAYQSQQLLTFSLQSPFTAYRRLRPGAIEDAVTEESLFCHLMLVNVVGEGRCFIPDS